MTRYTVEQVTLAHFEDRVLLEQFAQFAREVADAFQNKFDWKDFKIKWYASQHRMMLCRRDGLPVGVMLSRLYPSIFDEKIMILFQDLLYARPGTRAAKLLFDDFVDFGKANADHVLTTIASPTNIKPWSLEKLGFKMIEERYRLETKR